VLRVAKALPLAAAALMVGCSGLGQLAPSRPAAPGYVIADADRYTLNVVGACPEASISRVVVKYAEPDKSFDELQTIWAAHVAGEPTRSAVLFADGDGMVVDTSAGDVDHAKEVVVWWRGADGQEGSVSGVLGELKRSDVLWAKGIEDKTQFEQMELDVVFGC
jgi:hypothetical protein